MDKSILNRLPAELRLQIFEHVFPPGDLDVIFVWGRRTPFTTRWPRPGNSHLALLSTCHQLRTEAMPVLLAHTRLVVRTVILDRNTKLASITNAKWQDVDPPLEIIRSWAHMAPNVASKIIIYLGEWFTWSQRAPPEAVAELVRLTQSEVQGTKADLSIGIRGDSSAFCNEATRFEVVFPSTSSLPQAKFYVQEAMSGRERAIDPFFDRDRMFRDLRLARTKFERLFEILEEDAAEIEKGACKKISSL
ncbi:hypothetical protein CLAFUW4_03376 [Fulvia fulva]|uniref:F-box domain-containing protein n=1 Tax=Passalora fulva TaxID=5499 RepID=A0A9Q8P697_PASFU|nr:uncharacterized protein CLAFUR5_03356 [Fulvia fulva]KAK4631170.1 hypothetical protein CLAFUR4_03365 [Fulvia fulva]KAK4633143.1 hypothetical protein CLAFUR0_03370 [Fulvia fulva]UJO14597.1 hypothetical protein CLAFUR5_03356 [Fulvia fulva]WPV10539.1 hypothetical protein CLAFUW4_03376 [Fulvia fulva]WPV26439.1 hypothetical protein CLAFUW7_03368 [Fulvia fulva]